jgi:uncharacterized membrane protein
MATSEKLPTDRLRGEVQNLVGALGDRALETVRDKVSGVTERLTNYAEQGGGGGSSLIGAVTGARELAEGKSPGRAVLGAGMATVKEKVKNLFGGGGKGSGGKKLKLTNIVEFIDVGVPPRVAFNQWTQFSDFPSFMKKVENAERQSESEEKIHWKAQVWWSHRSWESTIQSQVPDQQIVWRSKGDKGHVDGSVTFHELAPNLTRILVVLEYHPQGLFERTGNLWRAQGRRARLELKHFRRHVMTQTILHPDDVEGWRGVIEDGKVVKDHETAVREERGGAEDEAQRRDGDAPEDELPEDELPEDELPEDEPEDELPEDEQPEDEQPEDEQPEDEQPEERSGNGRRSARGGTRTRVKAEPATARRRSRT